MEQELELKMYFFVIYQLTGIAKAIQSGHAALRYARRYAETNPMVWDFVDNHQTWIILDGGTTNDEFDITGKPIGTLNQIGDELSDNEIDFTYFREPDLNNSLTSLCFIVDERVFNKKDYPDFVNYLLKNGVYSNSEIIEIRMMGDDELIQRFSTSYKEWVRLVGGVKNVFLRDLIKDKELA